MTESQKLSRERLLVALKGCGLSDELCLAEDGRTVVCVALSAMFCFSKGGERETRARLTKSFGLYCNVAGDRLVWGADPKNGRPRKIAGTEILNVDAWARKVPLSAGLEFVFHGADRKDDASPFTVEGVASDEWPGYVSTYSFSLPVDALSSFKKLVLETARLLTPTFGLANLAAVPHVSLASDSEELAPAVRLIKRFRGLDLSLRSPTAEWLEEQGAVKGAGWMTILSQELIEKLGGSDGRDQSGRQGRFGPRLRRRRRFAGWGPPSAGRPQPIRADADLRPRLEVTGIPSTEHRPRRGVERRTR